MATAGSVQEGGSSCHGSQEQGQDAVNGHVSKTMQTVRQLAEGPYRGFNHTHLTEVLAEREGIDLSHSTVRRECCCRSTAAGTTGWRAEGPT